MSSVYTVGAVDFIIKIYPRQLAWVTFLTRQVNAVPETGGTNQLDIYRTASPANV